MADPAGAVPTVIDARRALIFSSDPKKTLPVTPVARMAAVAEGEDVAVTQMRAFVADCQECLRIPSRQNEFTVAISKRCRHVMQKAVDWYYDYDTTKGRVERELELGNWNAPVITVLADYTG
ncbi:hypothetical protein CYMTET_24574 [Cymbomonas tetramitiformis]|uniref:Uncharacterized protein n=1 Tax=Cymbomonas tetramitiformis TaxID=36881 RepID=A0AAE0FWF5_9CHLO|nr:hypothetical protein CYMTET_36703 [Cymbomonas tetramitiformis]KAK3266835.1 hypothetical protein CYMTET_24574 [Cymbomonas tetramitiformis]|eukprot:gene2828-3625_t